MSDDIAEKDAEWQDIASEFGFPWISMGDVNELPPHTIAEIVQRMAENILQLRKRIERLEGSIHTCHDKCQKAGCVATRERAYSAKLREALKEISLRSDTWQDHQIKKFMALISILSNEALAIKPPGGEE